MSTPKYQGKLPHITHGCGHTGPDHHPLSHKALLDMIALSRTYSESDSFVVRSCLRRIDQGCEKMTYPRHVALASVLAVADEARALFIEHVNNPAATAALSKLLSILAIDPELKLEAAPSEQDWSPSVTHGEAVAV